MDGAMNSYPRRSRVLIALVIVGLTLLPAAVLAQGVDGQVHTSQGPYQLDTEVVLINRVDGRIVIWDPAVGANTVDLNGKYTAWGGPYYDMAAGDFNGDGLQELAVIGGGALNAPGPLLHTFDPVHYRAGIAQLPQLSIDIGPSVWQFVRAGDIDGDQRDEIVTIRSTNEGAIQQRIQAYKFNIATGTWGTTPVWNLATAGGFVDVDLGDFNNDGAADVALVRGPDQVIILAGQNPGISLFDANVGGLSSWRKVRVGDVDGDSTADVALARPEAAATGNTPPAVIAIHATGASLWYDIYDWGFPDPPEDIELADANNDGRLEIMAFNNGGNAGIYTLNPRQGGVNNNVQEFLGVGDNAWSPNLVMGDANGDDTPERMLVRNDGSLLRVFRYNANGTALDVSANGPYADNFIAANLDGSGATRSPDLQVPNNVTLFHVLADGSNTNATVEVRNIGTGTFNWVAVPGSCPWLSMSTTVGAAGGAITLTLVPAFLPAGVPGTTFTCAIGIQATSLQGTVLNNNQTLTVHLLYVQTLFRQHLPAVQE
ncbi:MAG: FG-GAP repeat domain-containing protein [Anaerolineae bacterium]